MHGLAKPGRTMDDYAGHGDDLPGVRVDAMMERLPATASYAPVDDMRRHPALKRLPPGDDALLGLGEFLAGTGRSCGIRPACLSAPPLASREFSAVDE
jgi:hypothetical protein